MRKLWTEDEIAVLRELWGKVSKEELCKLFGRKRSFHSIICKANEVGLPSLHAKSYVDAEYVAELRRRLKL